MYDKKRKYPPPPPTFLFRSRRRHRSPPPFGAQLPGVELNSDGQIKVNGDGSDEMPARVLDLNTDALPRYIMFSIRYRLSIRP